MTLLINMRGNSDRFYVKEGLGEDLLCIEDRQLIRQWKKVMRLKEGGIVRLFDGNGNEFKYAIFNMQYPKKAQLKLLDKKYFEEKKNKIYLGFGMLKDQARMEWMVEKCTELGVDGFVPILADNSQYVGKKIETHYSASVRNKIRKQDRLEKKIVEACEQSGRVRVPEIMKIAFVNKVLESVGVIHGLPVRVVVMEKKLNLKSQIPNLKLRNNRKGNNILLLVGPEGGWSGDEIKYFEENNFEFMTVSNNILRAETAAIMGAGVLKI